METVLAISMTMTSIFCLLGCPIFHYKKFAFIMGPFCMVLETVKWIAFTLFFIPLPLVVANLYFLLVGVDVSPVFGTVYITVLIVVQIISNKAIHSKFGHYHDIPEFKRNPKDNDINNLLIA